MPTYGEMAQMIIAIVAALSWLQSWRNSRKLNAASKQIEVIHAATNSMKDALVAATGSAAHAQGLAEGIAVGKTVADARVADMAESRRGE